MKITKILFRGLVAASLFVAATLTTATDNAVANDGPGAGGGYIVKTNSDGPGAGGGYRTDNGNDGPGAGGGY